MLNVEAPSLSITDRACPQMARFRHSRESLKHHYISKAKTLNPTHTLQRLLQLCLPANEINSLCCCCWSTLVLLVHPRIPNRSIFTSVTVSSLRCMRDATTSAVHTAVSKVGCRQYIDSQDSRDAKYQSTGLRDSLV